MGGGEIQWTVGRAGWEGASSLKQGRGREGRKVDIQPMGQLGGPRGVREGRNNTVDDLWASWEGWMGEGK